MQLMTWRCAQEELQEATLRQSDIRHRQERLEEEQARAPRPQRAYVLSQSRAARMWLCDAVGMAEAVARRVQSLVEALVRRLAHGTTSAGDGAAAETLSASLAGLQHAGWASFDERAPARTLALAPRSLPRLRLHTGLEAAFR